MPTQRALTIMTAAAATAAALAGCGGEDEEAAARTVTVEAADGIEVVAGEYFFDPETIVVDGGPEALEITLHNRGSLAHNLRLFEDGAEVGGTVTFPGGETRSTQVDLDRGAYRLVCTVANHEELGMTGELEVR